MEESKPERAFGVLRMRTSALHPILWRREVRLHGLDERGWIIRRDDDAVRDESQRDGPLQISDIGVVVTELLVPIPAGEGIQPAIPKGAQAFHHQAWIRLHGLKHNQRHLRVPERTMDQKGVGSDRVPTNDEQGRPA